MRCLFLSVGYFITPESPATRVVVAIHLDDFTAYNFMDAVNYAEQADIVETECVPLIDRCGYPCTPAEYVACFPAGLT